MDDEQKQLKALDRASKAQDLLDNDMLKQAFADIETEFLKRWRSETNPQARDALWQAVQVNDQVQSILKKHIQSGKVAKAALDKLSNVVGMDRPQKFSTV